MEKDDITKKWKDAGFLPTLPPSTYKPKRVDNSHITIDEYRLLKAGSSVWSISNQAIILLSKDTIVQVKHKVINDTVVFAKPMQVIFEFMIPGIIGLGTDEWSFDYAITESYTLPQPRI